MMCAWNSLLGILPPWLRHEVDMQGSDHLQELRLRLDSPPEMILSTGILYLNRKIVRDDLLFCINTASRYSPWTASTVAQGYITARGGHRIGLCGEAVCKDGKITGIKELRSINIRVARDFPGIGKKAIIQGSVLILGAPGWGKTTLLRDIARNLAQEETVCVVDERDELFPEGFTRGKRMDVLSHCPKTMGIEMVLRTMGPACIAVDEITAVRDTEALLQAAGCGVRLLATAHASNMSDFHSRSIYDPLLQHNIFQTILVMRPDKSYYTERIMG